MTPPVPPLRREVLVGSAPAAAFARFTDDIARWWPLASHSVGGPGGSVAFTGGLLVETGPDGTGRYATPPEPPTVLAAG